MTRRVIAAIMLCIAFTVLMFALAITISTAHASYSYETAHSVSQCEKLAELVQVDKLASEAVFDPNASCVKSGVFELDHGATSSENLIAPLVEPAARATPQPVRTTPKPASVPKTASTPRVAPTPEWPRKFRLTHEWVNLGYRYPAGTILSTYGYYAPNDCYWELVGGCVPASSVQLL